jgi:hypothetical protein
VNLFSGRAVSGQAGACFPFVLVVKSRSLLSLARWSSAFSGRSFFLLPVCNLPVCISVYLEWKWVFPRGKKASVLAVALGLGGRTSLEALPVGGTGGLDRSWTP